MDKDTQNNIRVEKEDGAVWVFKGESLQGTEISHLMMMHADEYSLAELKEICYFAAVEIDSLHASLAKEPAKLEGSVVVPKTIPENVVKMLECSSYHWGDGTRDYFTPLYSMIVEEAARGGNE